MRSLKTVTIFILLTLFMSITDLKSQESEDFKLFNEAMELRIQREWKDALEKYELLRQKYPDSKYIDDADFWSAYILEEQGSEPDAFKAYQQIQKKYPDSPWADDAAMHQIGLAEKFVQQGQESYKEFLTEHLQSSDKNLKYQAALSLGKLGDKRAIPVLKEMSNNGDRDMRSVGNSLLHKFENPRFPGQNNPSQFKPAPTIPPKSKTDKKGKIIKQPTIKPPTKSQSPARIRPDTKINRPIQKQPPKRSIPPKTSPPKKKGKVGKFRD